MKVLLTLAMALSVVVPLAASAGAGDWRITKTAWTADDEQNYGNFIAAIGAAVESRRCNRVDTCLSSDANPYHSSDPANLQFHADCAELPYLLRSYFAWKNGLPFSYVSALNIRQMNGQDPGKDIRYTHFGNLVAGRTDILPKHIVFITKYPDAVDYIDNKIPGSISSANFRMIGDDKDSTPESDFYPVKLSPQGIRLGTMIYDPNGHVATIYKITADGRIFYIDSHPDNSLTSGMYNPKFVRSNPYQGAGFKNFRPLTVTDSGIVPTPDSELPDYSVEQYYGNKPDPSGDWTKGQFIANGRVLGYYDYLRVMMAGANFKENPLDDMHSILTDICTSLKDRVPAIASAIQYGIQNQTHPASLPENIYGTDGDWENYSTAARDARLKVSYMDLLNQVTQLLNRSKAKDPSIAYSGSNLAMDLLKVYQQDSAACQISYVNSDGRNVNLNLDDVRQRLFALSFDPYHCVELRWGATSSQELASCRQDSNKEAWYSQERWLRYQWQRGYDVNMAYTLDQLTGPFPGVGIAQAPNVDIVSLLKAAH